MSDAARNAVEFRCDMGGRVSSRCPRVKAQSASTSKCTARVIPCGRTGESSTPCQDSDRLLEPGAIQAFPRVQSPAWARGEIDLKRAVASIPVCLVSDAGQIGGRIPSKIQTRHSSHEHITEPLRHTPIAPQASILSECETVACPLPLRAFRARLSHESRDRSIRRDSHLLEERPLHGHQAGDPAGRL